MSSAVFRSPTLAFTVLLAEQEPERFERAAVRWHGRWELEAPADPAPARVRAHARRARSSHDVGARAGPSTTCGNTYATWSLDAGVGLFTLSRRMGTSLAMIDATYGH